MLRMRSQVAMMILINGVTMMSEMGRGLNEIVMLMRPRLCSGLVCNVMGWVGMQCDGAAAG
jgi:hypothetical protein